MTVLSAVLSPLLCENGVPQKEHDKNKLALNVSALPPNCKQESSLSVSPSCCRITTSKIEAPLSLSATLEDVLGDKKHRTRIE